MNQRLKKVVLVAGGFGLALGGFACPTRDLGPVAPVVQSGTRIEIEQNATDDVDLLVMVDNSNSMAQEQEHLTAEFQTMIDALTNPPDHNEDGKPDHPAVTDLHVGVVSSDMGTGGFAVTTCDNSTAGDDGVLVDTSDVPGCEASYPKFLSFEEENGDPAVIAADFACVATLGTGGCGFEQQLKAVRHALINNAGEGAPNEGFLRPDSLLAILMVTDEEDCSVYEGAGHANASDIFNVNLGLGPLNLRCFNHREQYVEPVSAYVDDILALRDDPDKIVVAAIVGIPPGIRHQCNLEQMKDDDFQCLLDLPAMQEVIDNSAVGKGERLTPSCDEPGLGEAFPPRRIVDFVRQVNQVGNNGIVRSICEDNFQPAMEAITSLIQSKFTGTCLERSLDIDPSGQVKCIIQEETTSAAPCLPGRIDLDQVVNGHRLCQVCQEGDGMDGRTRDELGTDLTPCGDFNGSGDFWRYLTAAETGDECPSGKIEFLGATIPGPSSKVSLECLSQVGIE